MQIEQFVKVASRLGQACQKLLRMAVQPQGEGMMLAESPLKPEVLPGTETSGREGGNLAGALVALPQ